MEKRSQVLFSPTNASSQKHVADCWGQGRQGRLSEGGKLSLNWILQKFSILPEKITAYDEIRYARAYLFFQVASQISTNNSGAHGHAYILQLFEEFKRYAWGPACLACVYRSMTRVTHMKDFLRTITGPFQFLQVLELNFCCSTLGIAILSSSLSSVLFRFGLNCIR